MGKFLTWKDLKEGKRSSSGTPLPAVLVSGLVFTTPGAEARPSWAFLFLPRPSLTVCPSAGLSILACPDLQRNREWFWRLARGELLMA